MLEPLLLEMHTLFNLLAGHVNALWHNNQLIVVIAQTMHNRDANAVRRFHGYIGAKEICVQFLAVRRFGGGNVAVIGLVQKTMLWVT